MLAGHTAGIINDQMNLIPVNIESIRIGQPLPFHLVDKNGVLLARKAFVIASKADLLAISQRGGGLFIDGVDGETLHRAYVDQLQIMMRAEKSIGEIAESKLDAGVLVRRVVDPSGPIDWLDLQVQAHHLLRDAQNPNFMDRLEQLHQTLGNEIQRNPDGALFALIYLSASETAKYSATHGMLVSVMCGLASREVLNWPDAQESILRKAALTMNLSISELQDRLASQLTPMDEQQRVQIKGHGHRSADLLASLGVTDTLWLEAVREHHDPQAGPLQDKSPAQRFARLIQRADMFSARLSPRAVRAAASPAAAMQACYFDENRQVDEAGAALIKAVGIYQPGSFVRLASNEVAVVIRRGGNTSTPRVAVIVNRNGMPTMDPIIRDTSSREHRVVASVPYRDIKVKINLGRMLTLTQAQTLERNW